MSNLIATRFGAFYYENNEVRAFKYDECPSKMIQSYPSRINHLSRIKRPCIRKGFLYKQDIDRLDDEFIEVSWDFALDLIAKELKKCYEDYGSSSIYAESYEWGGVGKIGWGRMLVRRLINILGGGVFELGDYSTGAGLSILPYIFNSSVAYERASDYAQIIKNAKTIVFWGANPLVTNLISHDIPLHEHQKYLDILKEKSLAKEIEIIFIDTHINKSAKYLNAKTILIKPNTDTAMILAMCKYLIDNSLYDIKFIEEKTIGFKECKAYLDTLDFDDLVSKTNVNKQIIIDLTNNLIKNPSIIISGRAIQRQEYGEQSYFSLSLLAALIGNIGKCGLGLEFNLSSGCKGESAKNTKKLKNLDEFLGVHKGENHYIPSSRLSECLLNPNTFITYKNQKLKYPEIKLIINACGSYLTHQPNTNESLKALAKCPTIISLEPFWNLSAKCSDIVLPIALEGERYDIEISSNKEILFALKPVKDNFYEAKSDFYICKEIAKRFNKSYEFCNDLDELELMQKLYLDIKSSYEEDGIKLIDFEEFLKQGYCKIEGLTQLEPYTRFSNLTKMNLFNKELESFNLDDCKGCATYFEPKEFKSFHKIFLSSIHSENRLHSMLDNSSIKAAYRELIYLNKDLAKEKEIQDNDDVLVFNERGKILCMAKISDDMPYDVVVVKQGAWANPKNGICTNGSVNFLCSSRISSKLSCSNTAHTCLVSIEKYKGDFIENDVFLPPKISLNTI